MPIIEGYRVIREIHRGGQGVVYEAFQEATRRRVALKVMLGGPFAGKASKRRFEREIELAASLRHPNIVTIHDSGIRVGMNRVLAKPSSSNQTTRRIRLICPISPPMNSTSRRLPSSRSPAKSSTTTCS